MDLKSFRKNGLDSKNILFLKKLSNNIRIIARIILSKNLIIRLLQTHNSSLTLILKLLIEEDLSGSMGLKLVMGLSTTGALNLIIKAV